MLDLQICKASGTKLGVHLRKWLPGLVLMSLLMLNKLLIFLSLKFLHLQNLIIGEDSLSEGMNAYVH